MNTATDINVRAIREQFPILNRDMNGKPMVFLDSAASSQKPTSVLGAITNYYKNTHANVHRGVYKLSQEATDAYEQARKTIANHINAGRPEEIIFTSGATDSINTVAYSLATGWGPGDEVVLTAMEHHSNIVPWQILAERNGFDLKFIPVNEDGTLDLSQLSTLLTDRTRLIAMVHVSNTLGTINPVKSIISEAHQKGIPVLVDGAQAMPHMKVNVRDLDVDFYAFSAHKMYGPTGMGVLYAKYHHLESMTPFRGGGEMIETVTLKGSTYNHPPHKFEAGTPNMAGAVGLAAAIDFMQEIGLDQIASHEANLLKYGTEVLSKIDGIQIIGQAPEKASVLSFIVEGLHPYDVGTLLDKQGVAVRTGHHCTQPLMDRFCIPGTIRASFGVYNTMQEIDALGEALTKAIMMLK